MPHTPLQIQKKLQEISGKDILLMLTDNTQRMITIKESAGGSIALRAHRMFLHAGEEVIASLGRWIGGRREEREVVREFINTNSSDFVTRPAARRTPTLRTAGRYYELREMAEDINGRYLGGRSVAAITWGRKITKRNPRTIRLGWYDPVRNLITLSQRLDRHDIPRYMVEYVLFHEMLHEIIGIEQSPSGRRDIHSKKFNLMEQTYPFYQEAQKFEKMKWGGE